MADSPDSFVAAAAPSHFSSKNPRNKKHTVINSINNNNIDESSEPVLLPPPRRLPVVSCMCQMPLSDDLPMRQVNSNSINNNNNL
jgi:hypothetical protein